MGCDIHLFVEAREPGGPWRPKRVTVSCWCVGHARTPERKKCFACGDTECVPFHDRNYDLFGMLANVRNGRGFAGIVTGGGFVPIALPKGLPADLSTELRNVLADHGEEAADRNNELYGCCWFGDHSLSHLTLAELEAYDWQQTTWQVGMVQPVAYADAAGKFYSELLPELRKLGAPDNVRIVFGFDN